MGNSRVKNKFSSKSKKERKNIKVTSEEKTHDNLENKVSMTKKSNQIFKIL